MDPQEPDSSSAAWVVAESVAAAKRSPPRWRRWLAIALAVASGLSAVGVSLVALERVPQDSSADVPLPNNMRFGFRGMRGTERWRCNDGHDHLSVPYWSGILCFGVISVACWARAGRK